MNDLNFFSVYEGKRKEKRNIEIYLYGAVGILLSIIVISLIFNIVRIFMINKSIKEYSVKLNEPSLQSQLREAEGINGKIKVLDKYEAALGDVASSVKKNDIVTEILLNDITGAMPVEISFVEFDISGYDISIKGTTRTRAAVGEFEHNLSGLSKVKKVHVDEITKDAAVGEDYSFVMTCVLKEGEVENENK